MKKETTLSGPALRLSPGPSLQLNNMLCNSNCKWNLRSVRCKVDGENRSKFTKAHHDRSAIACTGELVKEGKSYHLKNPRNLEIHEDPEF